MDCPRCSVELNEISQGDSTLQRCCECGGLWVDVADLNKMLLHANLPSLPAIGGYVNPDEIAGMCPACHVDLVAVEGGEKRMLHYDTCESCGGICPSDVFQSDSGAGSSSSPSTQIPPQDSHVS